MPKSPSSPSSSSYKILHGSCSSPKPASSAFAALCPMNDLYRFMADSINNKPPSIAANSFQLSMTIVIPLNIQSADGQSTAADSHRINCRLKVAPFHSAPVRPGLSCFLSFPTHLSFSFFLRVSLLSLLCSFSVSPLFPLSSPVIQALYCSFPSSFPFSFSFFTPFSLRPLSLCSVSCPPPFFT